MDAIIENLPLFVAGFLMTLRLLVVSGLGALVLGTIIATMRISPVAGAARIRDRLHRGGAQHPAHPRALLLAFVLPQLGDAPRLPGRRRHRPHGLHLAVRRRGDPLGHQRRAGRAGRGGPRASGSASGRPSDSWCMPQAMRSVIPPLINVLIALTKNTSVAAGFFVLELVAASRQVMQFNGNATIAILVAVAAFYLVITVPLGQAAELPREATGGEAMTSVLYDVPGPKARRISLIVSIIGGVLILAGLVGVFLLLAQPRENAGGVAQPGIFDPSRWDILLDRAFWRFMWRGIQGTLQMAAVAAVGALIFGVLLSMARTARLAIIRVPAIIVVEFFRGMPVLLMMLFILLVFSTGSYWAGVSALVVYNGAVIGEALRAGIASLPKGQRESGLAIGLTPLQMRFSIEFPQAFRLMLPIIIAQLVVLLKDTSLAYILGYHEMHQRRPARRDRRRSAAKYLFTLFFVVWAIYLIINMGLSWVARLVARRTASGGKPGRKGRKAERLIAQLGGAGVSGASAFVEDGDAVRARLAAGRKSDGATGNEGGAGPF